MTLDELPFREREALQQTLLEREQVVWLGRPQPYLFSFVSRSLALVTVFLVLFFGWFAYGMYDIGQFWVACVFGVVAVVCLGIAVASPWLGRHIQQRKLYVLTDRRAIVMRRNRGYLFPRSADMLRNITRHKNGTVSLELGLSPYFSYNSKSYPIGFLHLPAGEWEEVYELMKTPAYERKEMD